MVMAKEMVVARVQLYMHNGIVVKREIRGTNSSEFRSKVHELKQLVSHYMDDITARIDNRNNTNTDSSETFNDDMSVNMKHCIGFEVMIMPPIPEVPCR